MNPTIKLKTNGLRTFLSTQKSLRRVAKNTEIVKEIMVPLKGSLCLDLASEMFLIKEAAEMLTEIIVDNYVLATQTMQMHNKGCRFAYFCYEDVIFPLKNGGLKEK
ncbi:hypothetical protein KIN20_016133 [Parelaphostrongylus tenuis]|uniref:Uncharacterized protein n=1 Tax=Parelaphostrongylus tenuis TaxID=148309 RepID=A0AAD5MY71_PARTN|nr:hypothetical protein KIN20_016133 [Parelaphostrongylus tenuis]